MNYMKDKVFVDTNILVYFRDASESVKQKLAGELLQRLWKEKRGRLSTQVLSEYFVTVTRKLKPGIPASEAWIDVQAFIAWIPAPTDKALISRAYGAYTNYSLSWWDALIIAAAEQTGARIIASEDLSSGHEYFGIRVINPFLEEIP
jgi:predicted nucleic acid-binding protein